jgi:hypothetical protein
MLKFIKKKMTGHIISFLLKNKSNSEWTDYKIISMYMTQLNYIF